MNYISSETVTMTLVYGSGASWVEKHAAEELAKYVLLITGHAVRVVDDTAWNGDSGDVALIGNSESNPVIGELEKKGRFAFSEVKPGSDGFIIRTVEEGKNRFLVLGGHKPVASLYAVYDYLEKFCGVGFFIDGERVPPGKLPLGSISKVSNPRFRYRWYLRWNRPVLKKYTARWDTWPELKAKIDWEAKRKLNVRGKIGSDVEGTAMEGIVEEVFQVPPAPEELLMIHGNWWCISWLWPPEYRSLLKKKSLEYARKLGFIAECWIPFGGVPTRYKLKHPEHKYVPGDRPQIAPADSTAKKLTMQLVRKTIETFGTDHFYSMNPYGEHAPGKEPLQLKIDASLQTAQLIREIDSSPNVLWRIDAWDFMINPGGIWTNENVKEYLARMPDFIYIVDNAFDLMDVPLYEKHHHFYGHKWALAVINDLGGDDHLHGDMEDVLQKVKRIVADPEASHCIGFHLVPENAAINPMYWQLMTELAWNPEKVTLEGFLEEYVIRRYGEVSKENMLKSTNFIVQAMKPAYHGVWRSGRPLYQILLRFPLPTLREEFPERRQISLLVIPLYEQAFFHAIREKQNQEENRFYESDLIDLGRSYLGKLFDLYLIEFVFAVEKGEKEKQKQYAHLVWACLDWLEKICSTREDYSLLATIEAAKSVPGANRQIESAIKGHAFGQGYDTFDNYEQIHHFYKPLVRDYMEYVTGQRKEFYSCYEWEKNPVGIQWMSNPISVDEKYRFCGTPVQAVIEAFQSFMIRANDKEIEN